MGIYKSFDEEKGMWKWEGYGFVKYYATEAEADADEKNVWNEHMAKINAMNVISDMLIKCREISRRENA